MQSDDLTLDELRLALAPAIARAAAFDGWSDEALTQAAKSEGVDPAVVRLAFPGGAMGMISAWSEANDETVRLVFSDGRLGAMKVRERIRVLIMTRLELFTGQEEALRRALSIQAMPQNIAQSLKLSWRSADLMWRLAGDTATDYNHYTKRTLLAGIYTASLALFIDDTSANKTATQAFVDRRIEGVMKFEKAKARLLNSDIKFDVARFLGRLRYPAR